MGWRGRSTKLWTPGGNTKGQYKEIKRKDGTIKSYKLDGQLGQIVHSDSNRQAEEVPSSEQWEYPKCQTVVKVKNGLEYPKVTPLTSSVNGGKSKKRRTRRFKKKAQEKNKPRRERRKGELRRGTRGVRRSPLEREGRRKIDLK